MERRQISVHRTARYFLSAPIDSSTRDVWVVLHGYGQLANRFLNRFMPFSSSTRVFVAPEGPHRFYVEGSSGKVGASWMTKEERENDIADNHGMLSAMMGELSIGKGTRLHLLGFSQGAATAVRWYCQTSLSFMSLTLWAGSFPHDIDLGFNTPRLNETDMFLLWGTEDCLVPFEKVSEMESILKNHNIRFRSEHFSGGHDIDKQALDLLLKSAES